MPSSIQITDINGTATPSKDPISVTDVPFKVTLDYDADNSTFSIPERLSVASVTIRLVVVLADGLSIASSSDNAVAAGSHTGKELWVNPPEASALFGSGTGLSAMLSASLLDQYGTTPLCGPDGGYDIIQD